MTLQQLIGAMIFQATYLSGRKKVTADTIHSDVLSTDGYGTSNPKFIYRAFVRTTMKMAGRQDKPWPKNWFDLSITDLASKIFLILLMAGSFSASAQLQLDISSVKTENSNNAIQVGITYIKSFDSLFQIQDILSARNNSALAITPEFTVRTGTSDAFSSITAKVSALWMFFSQTDVGGILTPNSSKLFHTVPISFGVETNSRFTAVNTIVEAGYVPWYQGANIPEWLRQTSVGAFLQAGHKFAWDSAALSTGGMKDESKEDPGSTILRIKASAMANISTPVNVGSIPVSLRGSADVWYDIINGAPYYRYDATVQFHMTPDKHIDLIYQKGSGAPNFNEGDQYGIGLNITF